LAKASLRRALVRLAESFQAKANLLAQATFGVFAVLETVLDQNRVEELMLSSEAMSAIDVLW